jgi:hypothetical protein
VMVWTAPRAASDPHVDCAKVGVPSSTVNLKERRP